ncbi:O-antigen ligase family protein [Patescibacteria group bacterium]|nr:O-antigen ligase family protein [Patescibacteria group bacterium]
MKKSIKSTITTSLLASAACSLAALAVIYLPNFAPFIILGAIISIGLVIYILRQPVFGLYLIAFLLPFERLGSFETAGATVRASQIFAFITIIAWLLTFLAKKVNFSARNPLIIPIALLTGFSALSMINAINLQRAAMIFLFNTFVMIISIILPNLVFSRKILHRVIKVLFISCFLVSLFGIYQFLGDMAGLPPELTGLREHYTQKVFGFPRIQSTALEPLYFANYLLIPISLGIALTLRRGQQEKTPLRPLYIIIIVGLAIINLILTLSRGGFLGLFVVLLFSCLLLIKHLLSIKKIVLITIVIVVTAISAFGFLKITGEDKNVEVFIEQATSYSEGVGVEERFSSYDEAIELIGQHPIIGVGVGNFGPQVHKNPYQTPDTGWPIVNNEFLELWVEIGILGLASFLLLIGIIVMRTIKALRTSGDNLTKTILVGLFIAFLGILAQYQTFSILYILHIWFLIGLLVATQNLIFHSTKKHAATKKSGVVQNSD